MAPADARGLVPKMPALRHAAILAAALLMLLPAVLAETTPRAPRLHGAYHASTQSLDLAWTPASGTPHDSVYTVYENGVAIGTTNATSIQVDLTGWTEGVREYTVTVMFPNATVESPPSTPYRIVNNVRVPSDCPVASVSVYTKPPGADYAVYDECLPE